MISHEILSPQPYGGKIDYEGGSPVSIMKMKTILLKLDYNKFSCLHCYVLIPPPPPPHLTVNNTPDLMNHPLLSLLNIDIDLPRNLPLDFESSPNLHCYVLQY